MLARAELAGQWEHEATSLLHSGSREKASALTVWGWRPGTVLPTFRVGLLSSIKLVWGHLTDMTLDVSQSSQVDSAYESPQHPRVVKMKHSSLWLNWKLTVF